MNAAIIIAGGVGSHMGQEIPKRFINVGDKPVLVRILEAFRKHPLIDAIEVVRVDGSNYTNAMMVRLGVRLHIAVGSDRSVKLATPENLEFFKARTLKRPDPVEEGCFHADVAEGCWTAADISLVERRAA